MAGLKKGAKIEKVGEKKIEKPSGYKRLKGKENEAEEEEEEFDVAVLLRDDGDPYGCENCTPEILQCCRKQPAAMLAVVCILSISSSFIQYGVIPASSTQWQRQFKFTVFDLATIRSMFEVGNFLMAIPVIYFGEKGVHRPQWIGVGGVIVGIGAMLMVLPQFLAPPHRLMDTNIDLCNITREVIEEGCTETWSIYLIIFMAGEFLIGMGTMPNYVMSITFLDEHLSSRSSAIYTFIIELCELLGPLLGMLLTGAAVMSPGDIDKDHTSEMMEKLTSSDRNWYGAWWLAMIMGALLSWIGAALMFPFPSELSGAVVAHIKDTREAALMEESDEEMEDLGGMERPLLVRLRAALSNRVFIMTMIERCARVAFVAGFSMFLPKYLEGAFEVDSATASIAIAVCLIPAAIIGLCLGAFFQYQLHLEVLGNLRLCVAGAMASIVFLPAFLIKCRTAEIAGVTMAYPEAVLGDTQVFNEFGRYKLEVGCNSFCDCQTEDFVPVCFTPLDYSKPAKKSPSGLTKITYFSRCLAGCFENYNDTVISAENCTCVPGEGKISDGLCQTCSLNIMYAYMIALIWMVLLLYVRVNPSQQVMLRAVRFEYRSIAMSLTNALVRFFAIPGPYIYGGVMKGACLTSTTLCDKKREKTCVWYSRKKLAEFMTVSSAILGSVSMFAMAMALICYKSPKAKDHTKSAKKSRKEKSAKEVEKLSKPDKETPKNGKEKKAVEETAKKCGMKHSPYIKLE